MGMKGANGKWSVSKMILVFFSHLRYFYLQLNVTHK
jgi:hypothetical protein